MSVMFYWSRRKVTRVVRKKILDCLALKCSSLVQIACPATYTICWVGFCSWPSWHTQMIQPVPSRKRLAKPKCRTTYVYFFKDPATNDTVQTVQFDLKSHAITQGQPWGGVSAGLDTIGCYLDVMAGRHGSEWVAYDFNDGITWDNAFGLFADDPLPRKLNFAIFGTLSLTINNTALVCPDMRIAQGHVVMSNNWWIAGTECYHQDGIDGLICPCGNTKVTFSYVSWKTSTDNWFSVKYSWKPTISLFSNAESRGHLTPSVAFPTHLGSVEKKA